MQEDAHPVVSADRHDPEYISSSQRSLSSISADKSRGAEPSAPSSKGGLLYTSEQQQQLQQQHLNQQQMQQQRQQGNAEMPSALAGSAAADAPILSFEVDDAEGPLEGASNGLASQFGRLKVVFLL